MMWQVAAYTSGQLTVSQFDCLLLQHVLWQRPDEGPRIADWLLQQLAADDGLQQAEYLLTGPFPCCIHPADLGPSCACSCLLTCHKHLWHVVCLPSTHSSHAPPQSGCDWL